MLIAVPDPEMQSLFRIRNSFFPPNATVPDLFGDG